jgi:hypothetical protein
MSEHAKKTDQGAVTALICIAIFVIGVAVTTSLLYLFAPR